MRIYVCRLPVWQLLLMNDFPELLLLCQIETMGTHAIPPSLCCLPSPCLLMFFFVKTEEEEEDKEEDVSHWSSYEGNDGRRRRE